MAQFKNISPLGALDVPALGRIVEAGETIDVPADIVESFAGQAGTFEEVISAASRKSKPKGDEQTSEDGSDR